MQRVKSDCSCLLLALHNPAPSVQSLRGANLGVKAIYLAKMLRSREYDITKMLTFTSSTEAFMEGRLP